MTQIGTLSKKDDVDVLAAGPSNGLRWAQIIAAGKGGLNSSQFVGNGGLGCRSHGMQAVSHDAQVAAPSHRILFQCVSAQLCLFN